MGRLDRLAESTERVLHGLKADDHLKQRIIHTAETSPSASGSAGDSAIHSHGAIPYYFAMAAVAIILVIGLTATLRPSVRESGNRFASSAVHSSVSPVLLDSILSEDAQ